MYKRVIYLLIVFLIGLSDFCFAQTRVDSLLNDFLKHPEYILVAAHRAAHQEFPENSEKAILEAIRVKTDIVELDVRETKDHELVIIHDRTIDRTTTGKGLVKNFTLAELKALRLIFNGEPTDQVILTFDEALKLCKDKIIVDVDFKAETKESFVNALNILKANQMEDEVLFYIYDDYKLIKKLRKLDEDITVMPRAYSEKNIDKILKFEDIKVIHVDFTFYTDALMQEVLDAQSRVWANALGKYDTEQQESGTGYDTIIKKNVNVIQTDYPKELLVYLRAHKLHR
ncbi:glycerophosphoryl diester phosphodiesterase [Neptunitalea chrysea]|uniref:Glycerophosphoryl diester phosphodiesterase n=1 Tax=Neptunitalea chrysea TaxID=1647581 RepID=A0A9W6B9G9_9FLAO|nr:glycerophosphodiester phosphodiesterase family protein [Neptunitalea chrysea]GLB53833.1 glycerophosphoryl diester phosphodiesterase [Neptunitalea chrysea]